MISVLIVGAGKSSTYLIDNLLSNTQTPNPWQVVVADGDAENLKQKTINYPNAKTIVLDITNQKERQKWVQWADIIVSLMPPHLHILLAKDCLQFKKNLITSSYASDEMRALHPAVQEAGLMFMCEMGLDPGIDHMSASKLIDELHHLGANIYSFKSYCGGLIAAESDDNPWHYKFSWNPRNIINAGKDGAHFLENSKAINLSYQQLFEQNNIIHCQGMGDWAYYANRDSLSYLNLYHLPEAQDFLRATLRHPDFCKGWFALMQLGLTNTENNIDTQNLSYYNWLAQSVDYAGNNTSLQEFIFQKFNISNPQIQQMLVWLGIFSDKQINMGNQSSGDILLSILSEKWKMKEEDKDLVLMQHEFCYNIKNKNKKIVSTLAVKGENSNFSAMAKTVGMPMAILTELVVDKKLNLPIGVLIPTMPEIYNPVLNNLKKHGISFVDTSMDLA